MHANFRKTVVDFTVKLFDPKHLLPKRLTGKLLTGTELFNEAKKWLIDFNKNDSYIGMSYLSGNEAEFHSAHNIALDYYDDQMSKRIKSVHAANEIKALIDGLG